MYDLYNIGVEWFKTTRVIYQPNGARGTRYILDKELTTEQINYLSQFQNVILSTCYYKYAPEIKHKTVLLMDKIIDYKIPDVLQDTPYTRG